MVVRSYYCGKDVEIKKEYENVIAIDLGIRRIATLVSTLIKDQNSMEKSLEELELTISTLEGNLES